MIPAAVEAWSVGLVTDDANGEVLIRAYNFITPRVFPGSGGLKLTGMLAAPAAFALLVAP